LVAIITLSVVYRDVGKLDQALSLLEQELADRQSHLGANHADTRRLATNLAAVRIDRCLEYVEQQKLAQIFDRYFRKAEKKLLLIAGEKKVFHW